MLDFLFKHACIFCDALTNRKLDLCCACEKVLPFLENYCQRCACILPASQNICGHCLNSLEIDIRTTVLFHYENPIDKLIMNLKFQNNLIGAEILGELLANHLAEQYFNKNKPEVIIPVPLHSKRLRERGYNQALELARPISRKLNISIDPFSVIRKKHTDPQARLPAKERSKNIKNAFAVVRNFNCRHVAIVDDVITTGNTVFELCKVLHKFGVKKIDIWSVAKS